MSILCGNTVMDSQNLFLCNGNLLYALYFICHVFLPALAQKPFILFINIYWEVSLTVKYYLTVKIKAIHVI